MIRDDDIFERGDTIEWWVGPERPEDAGRVMQGAFRLWIIDENLERQAALELELTRDNVTGKTEVTGYSYTPMFMLDREEGASPRFELVDAHAALDAGTAGESLQKQLAKAVENCHAILGPDHDSGK